MTRRVLRIKDDRLPKIVLFSPPSRAIRKAGLSKVRVGEGKRTEFE